jgi:hypothetical protein
MSHGRNKYQSRGNRARVRELFWREWDPIGVSDSAEAMDEYDAYADTAYVMLMDQGAGEDDIAAFLWGIATDHMGLSPRPELEECCRSTASRLVAMKPDFELH